MSIYWSLKSVPELAPLSRKQRRRVHERCLRRYFLRAPVTRRSVVAYLILLAILMSSGFTGLYIASIFGWSDSLAVGVSAFFGATVGSYIFSRIAIPVLRPFYQEFIETKS